MRALTVTKAEREAALKVANVVRKMLGKRPVTRLRKGTICNGSFCPIATTIDWDGTFVDQNDDGVKVQAPGLPDFEVKSARARNFIHKFDKGLAPDLEL